MIESRLVTLRLLAKASASGLILYAGMLLFTFLPAPTSPAAVFCAIFFGSTLFAGSFFLYASGPEKWDELADRRHTRLQTLVFLPFAYGAGMLLMRVYLRTGYLLPLTDRRFLVLSTSLQDYFLPMTVLWVVQAFAEELFFRAFLYRNLKAIAPHWLAFLAVNFCFAAAHLTDWPYFVRLFVGSMIFTYCYDRFRGLYVATAAHAGLNTYGQLLCMTTLRRPQPPSWYLWIGVLTCLLLPFLAQAAWRALSATLLCARRALPASGEGASDLHPIGAPSD